MSEPSRPNRIDPTECDWWHTGSPVCRVWPISTRRDAVMAVRAPPETSSEYRVTRPMVAEE